MQETFEHNISQQLGDFKLQPSPTIWQEVDAALHPERKRRFIIWWWVGAALLVLSALGYWLNVYKPNEPTKQLNQNNTNIQPKNIAKQQQLPQNATIISPTQILTTTKVIRYFNINKEVVIKIAKQQKALISNAQLSTDITTNKKLTTALNDTNNTGRVSNYNAQQPANTALVTTIINSTTTTQTTNPTDSIIIKPINQNSSKTTDTITLKSSKKNTVSKPSHWLFTAGTGILQTGIGPNFNKAVYASSAAVGSGGLNGGVNNPTSSSVPAITAPKTGINIQLGIAYKTQLSKAWQLYIGLQYRYLSNKHGLKSDTAALYPNSFIADNNNFLTNNAHWLQTPISFIYNFKPKKTNQFGLLLGTSISYTLSEKWLIGNTNTGRFYYDPSANSKWLLGLHGGLSYSFNKKLTIAALAEYTLTPIQNDVTDKYHFIQYNLQIATPIVFKHKSSTKK